MQNTTRNLMEEQTDEKHLSNGRILLKLESVIYRTLKAIITAREEVLNAK